MNSSKYRKDNYKRTTAQLSLIEKFKNKELSSKEFKVIFDLLVSDQVVLDDLWREQLEINMREASDMPLVSCVGRLQHYYNRLKHHMANNQKMLEDAGSVSDEIWEMYNEGMISQEEHNWLLKSHNTRVLNIASEILDLGGRASEYNMEIDILKKRQHNWIRDGF